MSGFPREDVCPDARFGGEAGLGEEAGLEGGFVGGKVLESEQSAVEEGFAAIEDLLSIKEENGENGCDVPAVKRWREAKKLAVGVKRGPKIHVEDLEVGRGDVANAEIAKQIDREQSTFWH